VPSLVPSETRLYAGESTNWAYDGFVVTYGPINRTTSDATTDGGVIRRLPKLVTFREYPLPLVVAGVD